MPAAVEVHERTPVVSKDNTDIAIEVSAAKPVWDHLEQRGVRLDGGHRWNVTVSPGGVERLSASYSVHIASKHELIGGNRREL